MEGQEAAFSRSHTNGSIPLKRAMEQITELKTSSLKIITAATQEELQACDRLRELVHSRRSNLCSSEVFQFPLVPVAMRSCCMSMTQT